LTYKTAFPYTSNTKRPVLINLIVINYDHPARAIDLENITLLPIQEMFNY
jgi:hypothetical protein